ncbi:MAG: hypothetical protein P8R54_08100 [Myxococcota bacterium]|nr:hypothetical protein [Myxococcota bacterium]
MRLRLDKIASSTRNAELHRDVVIGMQIPAEHGAVIAVRVLDEKRTYNQIEDTGGRMMTFHRGDIIAGVLGSRAALRGYTGEVPDSVAIGDVLHLLNLGGVIGHCTSFSPEVGPPARVEVLGAVMRFSELGRRVGSPALIFPGSVALSPTLTPLPPVVLLVGSCMHAGKTLAACALIRAAAGRGLRVGAAKVTGVALRRDTLNMLDYGAHSAYTFADAGLPSTCDGDVIAAARGCINAAGVDSDLVVVELGDGLLGEYGVMDVIRDASIQQAASMVILAAPDPVAAWGGAKLLDGIGYGLDAVVGPATDNQAGRKFLSERMGVLALNAMTEADAYGEAILARLGLAGPPRLAAGIAP